MREVVVFDTNILLSGICWKGSPYRCLELARSGIVEGVTCQEILDELVEKLETKFNFSDSQIAATFADLLGFLRIVTIANTLKAIAADPDDDMVIECAIVSDATYIVTEDKKHLLPLGSYQGIAIVNAADFLVLVSRS